MRLPSRSVMGCTLCFAAVVLLSGCPAAEKRVKVRGKLLRNGQPAQVDVTGKQLPPGETGRMRVMFYPVKADNEAIVNDDGELTAIGGEEAGVESDGTFALGGGKNPGIPPGKYRIVITHIDPLTGKDLLKGAFNEGKSRITRDVTGDQEIVIDLAKPQG
jgi:hypothetical protein